jgi:hypothetical protein
MKKFKNLLLQNQLAKLNQTWYKLSLGKEKIKGQFLFKGEIITNVKLGWGHLKIFYSTTNFNQTWHKSSLGRGDSSLFK